MNDGDQFLAEIDGTTMWVSARRGGNQGKPIRIKYKILDIRQIPIPDPLPIATTAGPLDNRRIIDLLNRKMSEQFILNVIRDHPANYSLIPKDLEALRSAGASPNIIKAITEKATVQ
jgi:hypothetical protein